MLTYPDEVARLLTAVDLAALPVAAALHVVAAALDGSGDALLPTADDPAAVAARETLRAGTPLLSHEDDDADPTAAVVATSGSTGQPKGVLLPASALRASAGATHARLGGAGRWLLALPAHHVAGLQVLVRSIVAGTEPLVADLRGGFDLDVFASAAGDLAEDTRPTYTALVPTQLVRVLADGGRALEALASLDAVLLGGAAATPSLLDRAATAGVPVVTTYGMTETCGGCVYDGLPLDEVQIDVGDRVRLGGPMVARGYRGADPGSRSPFSVEGGTRWFTTDDVGEVVRGRLHLTGRADDVVVTGGVKVAPQAVEAVIGELDGVGECLVVGVPDPEWGQRLVAVVVGDPPPLATMRRHISRRLGAAAAPRELVVVEALPRTALGKPDRRTAVEVATSLAGASSRRPR